jgi:arsenate reductase (thioredoxin)
MTCSHADENCPFIPGAEARIPVRYEDPKAFDDTTEEAAQYDARSRQIASEMFFVFSRVTI